jgi:hypothetical protein
MAQQKGIAESVKDAIVDSIRGTGEVVNVVVDTVSRTLVNALKGTGAVGTAVTTTLADVLRGAILGTGSSARHSRHQVAQTLRKTTRLCRFSRDRECPSSRRHPRQAGRLERTERLTFGR